LFHIALNDTLLAGCRGRNELGESMQTVAIIGGGASGLLTAIQIINQGGHNDPRVYLIEKQETFGFGAAYSTRTAGTPCIIGELGSQANRDLGVSAFEDAAAKTNAIAGHSGRRRIRAYCTTKFQLRERSERELFALYALLLNDLNDPQESEP
jgi:glycine/D-amino acid oxidase-like deaminating enzyme